METPTEALLISQLGPTPSSHRLRLEVLQLLRRNVEKCLGDRSHYVACYGSFPLQTYLPSGDLDLTIITPPSLLETDSDILAAVRSQMEFVSRIRPNYDIKAFQEVNAEVKVLKFQVKGVAVDLSVNQMGGLLALRLFELVDSLTENHLFKRALLVTKAWATYEGRISGSQFGLLASYALGVLVICTLNTYPSARCSPTHVLSHLLQLLSTIDWERSVITCFGVVSLQEYAEGKVEELGSGDRMMFTMRDLGVGKQGGYFPKKYINLADPLKPDNNLGRSVGRGTFERIRLSFQAAYQRYLSQGECYLFPSLPKAETDSGRASPSTGSSSDEEPFQFSSELEAAQRAVQRALNATQGEGGGWTGKPWMASRMQVRIRVEDR